MASTLDVLPSLAAITGAHLPSRSIDGVDIIPLLEGEEGANPRNRFLFYYDGQLRGIREGKWKRVYEHRTRSYVGVEPGMDGVPGPYAFPTVPAALYDLERDVGETTDVTLQHPEVVARLDRLAEEARMALGDRLRGVVGSEVRPPGRRGFDRPGTVDHMAVGARVVLSTPPNPSYPGPGAHGLCDGVLGTRDHRDGRWMGWSGEDMEVVIDLGEARRVRRVGVDCLQAQEPWIFFPRWVEVSIAQEWGGGEGRWNLAGRHEQPLENDPAALVRRVEVEVSPDQAGADARFVRVRARNQGPLPDWHPGAPEEAWLFVDEVVVEGE